MTTDLQELRQKLEEPFYIEVAGQKKLAHKWKPQTAVSGGNKIICVPFLHKTMIIDRLNDIFTVAGWQEKYNPLPDGSKICELTVLINGEWITKSGIGKASAIEKEKGSESDALKRAATKLGIGAYLNKIPTKILSAKTGGNGKPAPVDHNGKFLYGDGLTNYINGTPYAQGLMIPLIMEYPSLWKRDDVKKLFNDLKDLK